MVREAGAAQSPPAYNYFLTSVFASTSFDLVHVNYHMVEKITIIYGNQASSCLAAASEESLSVRSLFSNDSDMARSTAEFHASFSEFQIMQFVNWKIKMGMEN